MKKIALLIALIVTCQGAFAYMEEYKSADIETLQGVGYSQDLLKILDTSRVLTQGSERDYVPYYSRKFYSDNVFIRGYQMLKRYVDPGQDDHIFGSHEVAWENTWFSLNPSYYTPKTPNDKYQRLHAKDIKRLEVAGKVVEGSGGVEAAIEYDKSEKSPWFVYEGL